MPSTKFRRGFKSDAERIAGELRSELRLNAATRLDPYLLAEHLCVPVLTLHELARVAPREVAHFLGAGRSVFSAMTVYVGRSKRIVVTNPSHARTRQVSSVCHEISHILLEHQPEGPISTNAGRAWNGVQEREADWLAGCLLVPQAAARAAARANQSDDDVAAAYGVSRPLASWRMNATGARIYASRLADYRQG